MGGADIGNAGGPKHRNGRVRKHEPTRNPISYCILRRQGTTNYALRQAECENASIS